AARRVARHSAGPRSGRREPLNTMTIASSSSTLSTVALKRELKAAEARKRAMALCLVAPLALFLFLIFVVPIGTLLTRAVQNPEIADALPRTVASLKDWDRKTPPADAAYAAIASDLGAVPEGETLGALARRLNTEIPGFRSLVAKTARAMPLADEQGQALTPAQVRARLIDLDERWADSAYWQAIAKNATRYSPFYV